MNTDIGKDIVAQISYIDAANFGGNLKATRELHQDSIGKMRKRALRKSKNARHKRKNVCKEMENDQNILLITTDTQRVDTRCAAWSYPEAVSPNLNRLAEGDFCLNGRYGWRTN